MNDVQVGKYVLESLTTGMYSDARIVYREYIQNAVDSLDMAMSLGLLSKDEQRIDVVISNRDRKITISDNGTGIPIEKAQSVLLNLGCSTKNPTSDRGFRGIGRLGGMSYCKKLVFTTKFAGELLGTKINFDCLKLRSMLVPNQKAENDIENDAGFVIAKITETSHFNDDKEAHYFRVEMEEVDPQSNLLNFDDIKKYLSQVAPVPYLSKSFTYTETILGFLSENGCNVEDFSIYIHENDEKTHQLNKTYQDRFFADKTRMITDTIREIKCFRVVSQNELLAVGWYGICNWYGTVSDDSVSGLRLRKGNIQIGNSSVLEQIFSERRFNGWVQGEIFALSENLIPNARRDDFEHNDTYNKFIDVLRNELGTEIKKNIRKASTTRNDPLLKFLENTTGKLEEASQLIKGGFNSPVEKEATIHTLNDISNQLAVTPIKSGQKGVKENAQQKIQERINEVVQCHNYKINEIRNMLQPQSIDLLEKTSNILSKKLAKDLVDEIIQEIITTIKGK